MNNFQNLFNTFKEAISQDNFVKLTLSKPIRKSEDLQNVYVRQVVLKEKEVFQFLYRNKTNDVTKNYSLSETIIELEELLLHQFRAAILFTLEKDLQVFISKKKQVSYKNTAASFKNKLPETHDKPKIKRAQKSEYLFHLGITNKEGQVVPKMADKYRQINKYLEIIEAQLKSIKLPKQVNIVDMGSGKGYLTFALFDYLVHQKKLNVSVTGIEIRESLVAYCNNIAKKCNFNTLNFIAKPIQEYDSKKIDVLIALHACDTATDDAIFKGLSAKASLIICAPCCHKQIRQQVKGKEQSSPLLKYGIFKERHFEMVTDTLRALILEKSNYKTNVFEFVNNEHTRKNIMLVAVKSSKKADLNALDTKIIDLKNQFNIESHYLETLLES